MPPPYFHVPSVPQLGRQVNEHEAHTHKPRCLITELLGLVLIRHVERLKEPVEGPPLGEERGGEELPCVV